VDFGSPTLEATRRRLLVRFGERVMPWWESLPQVIGALAEGWQLVVGDAVGRGNTSLVLRCRRADGRAAILKLAPDAELAAAEATALLAWQPSGRVPAVWGHDVARGALLLEALADETPLSESRTAVALPEIADLLAALHRSGTPMVGNGVVPLAERIEFIFTYWIGRHGSQGAAVTRAVPMDRLRQGRDLARELAADDRAAVLLHGDLHPGNVLDGGPERGLVAIDPRPCVGDAAVDAVDWVFWPVDDPCSWEPRSRALAPAVGVDHERLWAWCAAFAAMLAASEAAHGATTERIEAILGLAP
jgi:streptomycin 6-kinase